MKNFNEEKNIKVLQEAEGDIMVRDVCRKHQITEQTFYRWRNKFAPYGSEVRRLKELKHENAQLKQIVLDLTLDNRNLRDVNQKSGEAVGASSKGGLSITQHPVSEIVEHAGYYRLTQRPIGSSRCPRMLILKGAK